MSIALIAGSGGLPPHIARSLLAQGRPPVICEMRGFPSQVTGEFTRIPFRLETLGTFLRTLRSLGVVDVCMAGAVERPVIDPGAIDDGTVPLVPRLKAAMAKGDDGTLREIIALFEENGFAVIGAHQIAPELHPRAGVHTKASPPDLTADLSCAREAIAEMGRVDQGQSMLLQNGTVIAREDARGTAAMLEDHMRIEGADGLSGDPVSAAMDTVSDWFGSAADWLSGPARDGGDRRAVLFKAPKPNQNLQADMPTIGPDTARQAVQANLAGLVVPSGAVLVLDLARVIEILDAHGLFFWVMPEGTL